MIDPDYGYDPHQGVEQFDNCEIDKTRTAPITRWLRDAEKLDFADYRLPDGHVIHAITPDTAAEAYPEGQRLPDA
jgi:hypothetical protein